MNKLLKITALLFAFIIAAVVILVLLLPQLADTQAFRDQISNRVEQATGQTLTIEGDLSLSVFPWLGVRTQTIKLSQPKSLNATDTDFIAMAGAEIQVKLLPLLFKQQLEMQQIRLLQPSIYYLIDRNGNSSLDGISSPESSTTPTTASPSDTSTNPEALSGLLIAGISIVDGQLVYEDRQADSTIKVEKLNLEMGNLLSGDATELSLSAFITPDKESKPINVQLTGSSILNLLAETIEFSKLQAQIDQPVVNSNASDTVVAGIEKLHFDLKSQTLSISQLKTRLTTAQYSAKPLRIQFDAPQITANLAKETTNLFAYTFSESATNTKGAGNIEVKDWNQQLMFKGEVSSLTVSPQNAMNTFAVEHTPASDKALKSISASTTFNGGVNGVALKQLIMTLDESTLKGDLALTNFEAPAYRFDLSLDAIDLDAYMPAETETTSNNTDPNSSANASMAIVAPMSVFHDLNANGIFRIAKLKADGANLSDVKLTVQSSPGKVIIQPTAKLYSGDLTADMTFVESKEQSTLQIVSKINKVNIEPLLTDTDITDQLSGLANITTDILITEKAVVQTNTGTIGINISNGAIKGIDIKKILDETQTKIDSLRGKSNSLADKTEQEETRFTEMTATLKLKNNVMSNDDLSIKAPAFRIGGKGAINLEKETVDYTTGVTVVNTNEGQGGQSREDLKGLTIPVTFTGPMTAPDYSIDFRKLVKANTEKEADQKKQELLNKATDKLGLDNKQDNETEQTAEDALKEELKNKLLKKLSR